MRSVSLCTLLLIAACQPGSTDGSQCEGPLGAPRSAAEIETMPTCCTAEAGQAHCLSDGNVPDKLAPFLARCDPGSYCVPDTLLATGAAEPPQSCTAFGGDGVCLSRCIPKVAENEGLLRKETCTGPDELCVPCISPLDMMPTGACDMRALAKCVGDESTDNGNAASCDDPSTCNYDAGCPDVIDPSTLMSCGADAHCLDAALVTDAAQKSKLAACTDASKLCVPDAFIKSGGKFTPPTCKSVAGGEGRCLSRVLPDVKKQESSLPQDTCSANERCAPCFDPITGMTTGACALSCDPGPTQAPVTFPSCCSAKAHCVPTSAIPDAQEGNLGQDTCTAQSLCVPDQILLAQPIPTCTANSFLLGNYTGVCLSNCFDFGIQGVALAKGSCASGFTCAPCTQAGQPTGAPGCPM